MVVSMSYSAPPYALQVQRKKSEPFTTLATAIAPPLVLVPQSVNVEPVTWSTS